MNSGNSSVFKRFRRLRRNAKCVHCGTGRRVEFAHLEKTPLTPNGKGRGRKERFYDIIYHPQAYTTLCKDCHALYDDEGLDKMVKFPSLLELGLVV